MQLDLFASTGLQHSPGAAAPGRTILVRHRWARRYILRVLDDGTLRVTVPRWGSKREAKAFVEQSGAWISRQRLKQQARPAVVHPNEPQLPGVPDARTVRVGVELRTRAAHELPPQLLALAERLGITVARLSIRNQRSRWGACSARGSITLNWRLILVPDFVREYVMIHELMHRRELNHSKRFWAHVAAACPRHLEARKWLLTEGQRLFAGQETC